MARLLLTGDTHYGVLAAVRALRAGGDEPWLATPARRSYAALSRAAAGVDLVPSPDAQPDAFVAAVAAAARRRGVEAVLPGSEGALAALAGREQTFGGTTLAVGPAASVTRAGDKQELARLAAAAGLDAPPTQTLTRAELEVGAEVPLPAIVKPLSSLVELPDGGRLRGWARRVDDRAELEAATVSAPGERWLVQPFLEGDLYAVAGVAWRGDVAATVHQVARRLWPPQSGGSSYAVTVPRDTALDEGLGLLLGGLAWSGLFQAQFLQAHGRQHLIDLNLRVYGSLALAVAAGANLPALWVDLLLDRPPRDASYASGVSFRAPEKDLQALALLFRSGARGEALRGLVPRARGVQSVFALRDPLPLAAVAAKLAARRRER